MAHIAVVCPRCQSRYQVEPSLRGLTMRCPNSVCRAIFEVREEGAAPPAPSPTAPIPPKTSQVSGTVGEVVPILRAEQVQPQAPPLEPATRPSPPAGQEVVLELRTDAEPRRTH